MRERTKSDTIALGKPFSKTTGHSIKDREDFEELSKFYMEKYGNIKKPMSKEKEKTIIKKQPKKTKRTIAKKTNTKQLRELNKKPLPKKLSLGKYQKTYDYWEKESLKIGKEKDFFKKMVIATRARISQFSNKGLGDAWLKREEIINHLFEMNNEYWKLGNRMLFSRELVKAGVFKNGGGEITFFMTLQRERERRKLSHKTIKNGMKILKVWDNWDKDSYEKEEKYWKEVYTKIKENDKKLKGKKEFRADFVKAVVKRGIYKFANNYYKLANEKRDLIIKKVPRKNLENVKKVLELQEEYIKQLDN